MITSILDTDLYKLTMNMALCQLYPRTLSKYIFINRDKREFPDGFVKQLREVVNSFASLYLTRDEKDFLVEKCYYFNPVYLDFLAGYRFDPNEVILNQYGSDLTIEIIGPSYRTVFWEVPLMATVSELYFNMTNQKPFNEEKRRSINKSKALDFAEANIYYSEFGTRRRFSYQIQDEVISDLKEYGKGHILGTSNVHFAMKHDLIPMGTVAHEWYSFHAALFGFKMANEMANEKWTEVFKGDLGTALPDTFTTDVFFKSFNTKYAKLYDGLRQDSGEPLKFLVKVLDHYRKLRINSMTKMALFSDNLKSIKQILEIHEACRDKIIDRYGIGTWLTNDVGVKPLNIVIKLVGCNFNNEWVKTIKLSDDVKKHTGDEDIIKLCKNTLGIED
jgi:nicotinate phosphoribosyltransferase